MVISAVFLLSVVMVPISQVTKSQVNLVRKLNIDLRKWMRKVAILNQLKSRKIYTVRFLAPEEAQANNLGYYIPLPHKKVKKCSLPIVYFLYQFVSDTI